MRQKRELLFLWKKQVWDWLNFDESYLTKLSAAVTQLSWKGIKQYRVKSRRERAEKVDISRIMAFYIIRALRNDRRQWYFQSELNSLTSYLQKSPVSVIIFDVLLATRSSKRKPKTDLGQLQVKKKLLKSNCLASLRGRQRGWEVVYCVPQWIINKENCVGVEKQKRKSMCQKLTWEASESISLQNN